MEDKDCWQGTIRAKPLLLLRNYKMQNRKKQKQIAWWQVHIFIRVLLHPYCALRGVRGWMSGKVLIRGRELYCYAVFVSAFEMHYSPFLITA